MPIVHLSRNEIKNSQIAGNVFQTFNQVDPTNVSESYFSENTITNDSFVQDNYMRGFEFKNNKIDKTTINYNIVNFDELQQIV